MNYTDICEASVSDFNKTLINLINAICSLDDTTFIAANKNKIINDFILNSNYKYKYIEFFIIKCFKYQTQINDGDDNFFLNTNFNQDINDNELDSVVYILNKVDTNTNMNENMLFEKIFIFKDYWINMKESNKKVFKSYMKILLTLSINYFEAWDAKNNK